MAVGSRTLLPCSILVSLLCISVAQNCSSYTFTNNRLFNSCRELPYLKGHIHWDYRPSTNQVAIAYRATQTSQGWVAWGINLSGIGMVGSQALIAFFTSNGTLTAYPTPITNYNPSLQPGTLSFQVSNVFAEFVDEEMIIFALVGPLTNGTIVNHVWQAGNSVTNNIPDMHPLNPPNLQSFGQLDFLSA